MIPLHDVCIADTSLSGLALAHGLCARGLDVLLIEDPLEKALAEDELWFFGEAEEALLQALGLDGWLRRSAMPVATAAHYLGRECVVTRPDAAWVTSAGDGREELVRAVTAVAGIARSRITGVTRQPNGARVWLADGEAVDARMAVFSGDPQRVTGIDGLPMAQVVALQHATRHHLRIRLLERFDLPYPVMHFRGAGSDLGWHSFTAACRAGRISADLLTYWPPGHRFERAMMEGQATAVLREILPQLEEEAGAFEATPLGRPQRYDLFERANPSEPELILSGDARTQLCPSSGARQELALLDAVILMEHLPERLERGGSTTLRVEPLADDPRRIRLVRHAFRTCREEREWTQGHWRLAPMHRWVARRTPPSVERVLTAVENRLDQLAPVVHGTAGSLFEAMRKWWTPGDWKGQIGKRLAGLRIVLTAIQKSPWQKGKARYG